MYMGSQPRLSSYMNYKPCGLFMGELSPAAKKRKKEYDTKYESSPERVKYREELNQERRKRGIYGEGGPDMSHTREGNMVPESPHTNRARHFKERGTLKSSSPIDQAFLLLKGQLNQ